MRKWKYNTQVRPDDMRDLFRRIALMTSAVVGSSRSFIVAIVIVITWAATGPLMGFSETWQLLINTFTTIMTFLMVFLIQNTQNRDAKAMQLKLNELIRAVKYARNRMVDIEELPDEELEALHEEFRQIHHNARKRHESKKNGNGKNGKCDHPAHSVPPPHHE